MNIETPSLKMEIGGSSKKLLTIYRTVQLQMQKTAVLMKHFSHPFPKSSDLLDQ
jgi:hypothetical protein